jgi:hypothetical protein
VVTTSRLIIAGAERRLQTIRRTEVQFGGAEPIKEASQMRDYCVAKSLLRSCCIGLALRSCRGGSSIPI